MKIIYKKKQSCGFRLSELILRLNKDICLFGRFCLQKLDTKIRAAMIRGAYFVIEISSCKQHFLLQELDKCLLQNV